MPTVPNTGIIPLSRGPPPYQVRVFTHAPNRIVTSANWSFDRVKVYAQARSLNFARIAGTEVTAPREGHKAHADEGPRQAGLGLVAHEAAEDLLHVFQGQGVIHFWVNT